jgi:hypothetical protein
LSNFLKSAGNSIVSNKGPAIISLIKHLQYLSKINKLCVSI